MIISHKYKFIFIKTFKTAGTSIEVFLSQYCDENDIITSTYPYVESHFPRNYQGSWNPFPEIIANKGRGLRSIIRELLRQNMFMEHIPACTVRNRISTKMWNDYFKFCVERNPWDKTLSHYHMINYRAGGNMTFDEYIDRKNFCLNYPLYTDSKHNLIVDEVIKYESLMDELARIFDKLGVPFEGRLGVRAKSKYRKDKKPYQEVFSNEQREIIEKAFVKEIEMHKYTF